MIKPIILIIALTSLIYSPDCKLSSATVNNEFHQIDSSVDSHIGGNIWLPNFGGLDDLSIFKPFNEVEYNISNLSSYTLENVRVHPYFSENRVASRKTHYRFLVSESGVIQIELNEDYATFTDLEGREIKFSLKPKELRNIFSVNNNIIWYNSERDMYSYNLDTKESDYYILPGVINYAPPHSIYICYNHYRGEITTNVDIYGIEENHIMLSDSIVINDNFNNLFPVAVYYYSNNVIVCMVEAIIYYKNSSMVGKSVLDHKLSYSYFYNGDKNKYIAAIDNKNNYKLLSLDRQNGMGETIKEGILGNVLVSSLSCNNDFIFIGTYDAAGIVKIHTYEIKGSKKGRNLEIPRDMGVVLKIIPNEKGMSIALCEKGFLIIDVLKNKIKKQILTGGRCSSLDRSGIYLYIECSNGSLYQLSS